MQLSTITGSHDERLLTVRPVNRKPLNNSVEPHVECAHATEGAIDLDQIVVDTDPYRHGPRSARRRPHGLADRPTEVGVGKDGFDFEESEQVINRRVFGYWHARDFARSVPPAIQT